MATVAGKGEVRNGSSYKHSWLTLGDEDVGTPVGASRFPDASIQVSGTFSSASVTIEGTNDNVTWFTLNDIGGAPLVFTSDGLRQILEVVDRIRPSVNAAGDANTDIDVTFIGVGYQ